MPTTIDSAGITFNDTSTITSANTFIAKPASPINGQVLSYNGSTWIGQNPNVSPTSAKAWVNFNGTLATPIAPSSSHNVSSVTKNGTGDYTINFTTPMGDTNYVLIGEVGRTTADTGPDGRAKFGISYGSSTTPALKTTSQVRCESVSTATNYDGYGILAIVFGN